MDEARGRFTRAQVDQLLKPVKKKRVFRTQGHDHLAGWDVYAHLTRMFGFDGWDKEITRLELVFEFSSEKTYKDKDGKPQVREQWTVCYRCEVRLSIRDPQGRLAVIRDGAAAGTANNLPGRGDAHDFAMKNSVTYAVKVAAKDLGDQFGLSLYDKGRLDGVVLRTLVGGTDVDGDIEENVPAPRSLGHDEVEPVEDTGEEPDVPDPSAEDRRQELFTRLAAKAKTLTSEQRAEYDKFKASVGLAKPAVEMTVADLERLDSWFDPATPVPA